MGWVISILWGVINGIYKATVSTTDLKFLVLFAMVHVVLAVATLGLGDRTVCDILLPPRKIFKPSIHSLMEGAFDVTVAIPRAIIYYITLYVRAYFLAIRLVFLLYAALIPALLAPLALSIILGLVYGFDAPVDAHRLAFELAILSVIPSWMYWYWRIDGKRLVYNFRRAFACIV